MGTQFPSKDEVEKLAKRTVKPVASRPVASVTDWRVEPAPESSPVEARFGGYTFTKELRCVAREYGRMRSEQGLEPDERVARFILNACRAPSADAMSTTWKVNVPPGMTDEALVASFTGLTVPPEMKRKFGGAWLIRKGDQASITLAAGSADDAVTASLADAAGRIKVSGVLMGAEQVVSFVNRGQDAVAECEPDRSLSLPSFGFTCTLAETDPWAWIEVVTRSSGRWLLDSRAILLGRRDTTTALELTRQDRGAERSLRGWVSVTSNLDQVLLPKELLEAGPLPLRVVVTTYRPDGSPWGLYLVLLATTQLPQPEPRTVASHRLSDSAHRAW